MLWNSLGTSVLFLTQVNKQEPFYVLETPPFTTGKTGYSTAGAGAAGATYFGKLALVKSLVQRLNEQSLDWRVNASYCAEVGARKVHLSVAPFFGFLNPLYTP